MALRYQRKKSYRSQWGPLWVPHRCCRPSNSKEPPALPIAFNARQACVFLNCPMVLFRGTLWLHQQPWGLSCLISWIFYLPQRQRESFTAFDITQGFKEASYPSASSKFQVSWFTEHCASQYNAILNYEVSDSNYTKIQHTQTHTHNHKLNIKQSPVSSIWNSHWSSRHTRKCISLIKKQNQNNILPVFNWTLGTQPSAWLWSLGLRSRWEMGWGGHSGAREGEGRGTGAGM